jgi:hypothetical protein
MFQFSNLLNRADAERQRRRVLFGNAPHSTEANTGTDGEVPLEQDDSIPDRVRRELDEQMERLTKLLDNVESLESDESPFALEASQETSEPLSSPPQIFRGEESETEQSLDPAVECDGNSLDVETSHDAESTSPLTDGPRPNLDTAVFGLGVEVNSDLVFAASSAGDATEGTPCESISVHTEEVVPFPGLKKSVGCEADHSVAKQALGIDGPNDKSNPTARPSARSAQRQKVFVRRQIPLRMPAKPPKTLSMRRGVVQDFSCAEQNSDDVPMLEIFEPEHDSTSPARVVTHPVPERRETKESVSPAEIQWSPVVIEMAMPHSVGPQTISVAPPPSHVVLLKL